VACRWLLAVHGEEVLVAVGVETGGRDLRWEKLVCQDMYYGRKKRNRPQAISFSFSITNFNGASPNGVVSD